MESWQPGRPGSQSGHGGWPGRGAAECAAAVAPKAYIGLFKDNAVAVLDTATQQRHEDDPHSDRPARPGRHSRRPLGLRQQRRRLGRVASSTPRTDTVAATIDVGHDAARSGDHAGWQPGAGRRLRHQPGRGHRHQHQHRRVAGAGAAAAQHRASRRTARRRTPPARSRAQTALAIIDVASGTQTGSMPLDKTPRALNVSPEGRAGLHAGGRRRAAGRWTSATQQLATQIPTGASPHHPLFTPDGKLGMVVSQGPGDAGPVRPDDVHGDWLDQGRRRCRTGSA